MKGSNQKSGKSRPQYNSIDSESSESDELKNGKYIPRLTDAPIINNCSSKSSFSLNKDYLAAISHGFLDSSKMTPSLSSPDMATNSIEFKSESIDLTNPILDSKPVTILEKLESNLNKNFK